jgi:hypothetical protein
MCAGDDKTDEDMVSYWRSSSAFPRPLLTLDPPQFHSMARIFSTATPGVAPTISPPASLALFPSLTDGTDMPEPGRAEAVESKLDPGSMYMIAIEAREVR